MTIPAKRKDGWMVGRWDLSNTICEAKSSTNATVLIIATINVLSGNVMDLAGCCLLDGGIHLILRIQGGIRASSWMSELSGDATLIVWQGMMSKIGMISNTLWLLPLLNAMPM
jgi:hypothetical protein